MRSHYAQHHRFTVTCHLPILQGGKLSLRELLGSFALHRVGSLARVWGRQPWGPEVGWGGPEHPLEHRLACLPDKERERPGSLGSCSYKDSTTMVVFPWHLFSG